MKYYTDENCHYFVDTNPKNKVQASHDVIAVCDLACHFEVGIRRKSALNGKKEITEEEFYDKFNEVTENILKMMEKHNDSRRKGTRIGRAIYRRRGLSFKSRHDRKLYL